MSHLIFGNCFKSTIYTLANIQKKYIYYHYYTSVAKNYRDILIKTDYKLLTSDL